MFKEKFYSFLESKLFYFYFFINYIDEKRINKKYMKKFYANCKKNGFLDFSFDRLKQNKKSDTLFILGSGSSINDISEDMWQHIKKHDSFGFNFWLIHEYIPNFFMFESRSIGKNGILLEQLLKNRSKDYNKKKTFVLMKDFKTSTMKCNDIPSEIRSNFMLAPKYNFYGTSQVTFIKSLRLSQKLNLLSHNIVYSRRASLFSIIYIGYRLGYKNIVLAGIDLNNTDYFYDSDDYDQNNVPENFEKGIIHTTARDSDTDFKIDELVYILNDELLAKEDQKLYVLNKNSLLAQKLEAYSI